jgi:hypothetical protein
VGAKDGSYGVAAEEPPPDGRPPLGIFDGSCPGDTETFVPDGSFIVSLEGATYAPMSMYGFDAGGGILIGDDPGSCVGMF